MVRTPDPTQTPGPARTPGRTRDAERSVAQLNMLHSLAAKLNVLGDADEIGAAITAELRTIVDYHNCRVYLLQPTGRADAGRVPRRDVLRVREGDLETLITEIGEGITGHVAATRGVAHHARCPRGATSRSRSPAPTTISRVDARRADGRRRQVLGRDHAVDARVREVRRGGPAAARGPGLARSGRAPEREALPGRTRGGGDLDGAAAAVADADAAALDRRHPAGGDRDRCPRTGRGDRRRVPPRRETGDFHLVRLARHRRRRTDRPAGGHPRRAVRRRRERSSSSEPSPS